jgi:hypothetical protein
VIKFIGNLAVETPTTTAGYHGILTSITFKTVLLSYFSTEHKEGDAWCNAGQQEVQDTTLASLVCTLEEQATATECSTKT